MRTGFAGASAVVQSASCEHPFCEFACYIYQAPYRTRDPGKSRSLVRSRDGFDSTEVFEFVKAHQAIWPIRTQCRVLDVSTSGFYAWRARQPSARDIADDELAGVILGIYALSRETYGRPRIHAELRLQGIHVSRKPRSTPFKSHRYS